jgi:hypothetical protein
MVEFVVAKCPRCGADLEVTHDSDHASCKFCQAEVLVVNDAKAPAPSPGSSSELEKKELAFQWAQKDLQKLQTQEWQLKSKIDMYENPRKVNPKGGMVVVYILCLMAIFMSAMLGGLFYVLQIYYIYGLTKTTCPLLMIVVIGVSIAFMFVSKITSDVAAKRKYEAGLADPEYPKAVAEYNALLPKIQVAQAEVCKREQELRDFVK